MYGVSKTLFNLFYSPNLFFFFKRERERNVGRGGETKMKQLKRKTYGETNLWERRNVKTCKSCWKRKKKIV